MKRSNEDNPPHESHFKHPFTSILAGPTSCGKSSWLKSLLKNKHKIVPTPEVVYWCYSEWQPLYETIPDVLFVDGLIDIEQIDTNKRNLVILDDLMDEKNDSISKLFTKLSHHRNISVMYVTQNIFEQHKDSRTISLNTQYMIAFKNPRAPAQIQHLARQIYPANSHYMLDAFLKATAKPHGYLFIDLTQATPDNYRLRSSIFGRPGYDYNSEVIYLEDIKRKRTK